MANKQLCMIKPDLARLRRQAKKACLSLESSSSTDILEFHCGLQKDHYSENMLINQVIWSSVERHYMPAWNTKAACMQNLLFLLLLPPFFRCHPTRARARVSIPADSGHNQYMIQKRAKRRRTDMKCFLRKNLGHKSPLKLYNKGWVKQVIIFHKP